MEQEKIKKVVKDKPDIDTKKSSRRHRDRIKPLCDKSPDLTAHSSIRIPKNRKQVKGIFKNIECPGTMLTFSFRKYKEPIKTYYLMDGGEYELPIEVVEHLNGNCGYKQHAWKLETNKSIPNEMDKKGSNKVVKSIISRFMFNPKEYVTT